MGLGAGAGAAIGGVAGGLGAIGGSLFSSGASQKAAGTSAFVSELELMNSQQQAQIARGYEQPFVNAGYNALGPLQAVAGQTPGQPYLDQAQYYLGNAAGWQKLAGQNLPPSVVTENWLQQTPGYQFQLGQGLKAVQASAAARGLGVSGSSLKGAATYATGLADSNYQTQFQNAQTAYLDMLNQATGQSQLGQFSQNLGTTAQAMQGQQYGQFANIANLGQSAASGAAQASTAQASQANQALSTGAQQFGNYTTQAGTAQAAGLSGATNALTGGVNNYLSYQAMQSALQGSQAASTTQGLSSFSGYAPALSAGTSNYLGTGFSTPS